MIKKINSETIDLGRNNSVTEECIANCPMLKGIPTEEREHFLIGCIAELGTSIVCLRGPTQGQNTLICQASNEAKNDIQKAKASANTTAFKLGFAACMGKETGVATLPVSQEGS